MEPMESRVAPDEDYQLWLLLNQVNDGMARARENEVGQFGVSLIQAAAMFVIKAIDGPATPTEIARWLFREQNTVSQLLIRMEKQGLVRRVKSQKRNPENKSTLRVVLTDKGEDIFREQLEGRAVIHRILSRLTPRERRNLKAYLQKLREQTVEELVVRPNLPFP